ncbi:MULTISPECIES: hypothetical protein [unclassified Streptomyces]|uniref:hypothetical protein n=1 Tax=unclassified Streptomyces TaxID=2593676 RepID=UPI002E3284AE|nr:hypothetical protein [Streptomyces sp. NBC_01689]
MMRSTRLLVAAVILGCSAALGTAAAQGGLAGSLDSSADIVVPAPAASPTDLPGSDDIPLCC